MLDDRTAADRDRDRLNHFVWNNRADRFAWTAYLRQPPGQDDTPAYSAAARRGELGGLPSTWIYTTTLELFHDEIVDYAHRLESAGVSVTLRIVPAAAHAFELFEKNEPSRRLVADARDWLASRLEPHD
jgi:Esterase/lipase